MDKNIEQTIKPTPQELVAHIRPGVMRYVNDIITEMQDEIIMLMKDDNYVDILTVIGNELIKKAQNG